MKIPDIHNNKQFEKNVDSSSKENVIDFYIILKRISLYAVVDFNDGFVFRNWRQLTSGVKKLSLKNVALHVYYS